MFCKKELPDPVVLFFTGYTFPVSSLEPVLTTTSLMRKPASCMELPDKAVNSKNKD
jgi:hypothetical protein